MHIYVHVNKYAINIYNLFYIPDILKLESQLLFS